MPQDRSSAAAVSPETPPPTIATVADSRSGGVMTWNVSP
jgi:hypothetical protein